MSRRDKSPERRKLPPGVASMHPDDMVPEFDVVWEVRFGRCCYSGDELVSLYRVPCFIRLNVRRVVQGAEGKKPKTGEVTGTCVRYGVRRLLARDATKSLLSLIERAESADLAPDDAVEIDRWSRSFRFAIADPTHSGTMRWDFRTSKKIQSQLFWLAGRLGIAGSTLGAVALMAGLEQQSAVIPEHAEYMAAIVAELDNLIARRARRLELLLSVAEGGRK